MLHTFFIYFLDIHSFCVKQILEVEDKIIITLVLLTATLLMHDLRAKGIA